MKCDKCKTDKHNILIQGNDEKYLCKPCTREEIKQDIEKIKQSKEQAA